MKDISRRQLLTAGAVLGAGELYKKENIHSVTKEKSIFKREGPADTRLIRVGILGCDKSSHTKFMWGKLINPPKGRRMTGMIMTHVWDYDKIEKNNFAQRYGCNAVENYTDMIGRVDGVILGTYSNLRYHHLMLRPYLEEGIPVFINRPFTDSLTHARQIINMAERYGAPIMCASSFEFCKEIEMIRQQIEQWEWKIRGYTSDNVMFDYATHGVHGLYLLHKLFGGPVESVSFQCPDWKKPNGAMILKHRNNRTGEVYFGSMMQINNGDRAWVKVYGPGFSYFEKEFLLGVTPKDSETFFWLPLLLEIQSMFETGIMPEPPESLYEKTRIYLAGWLSMLEHHGGPVKLDEIPIDYECPINTEGSWEPVEYPEGYFR